MKTILSKCIQKSLKYRFRILAGLLFLVFLISTWFVFYQKPKYPEALHISLQEQLKQIIQSTLLKQQPLSHNLQFQKMWTEVAGQKDQIKAFFRYSFDSEDGARLFVQGQATMVRNTVDDIQDLWRVIDIKTNNDKIEFSKPIVLLSGSKNQKADANIDTDTDTDTTTDTDIDTTTATDTTTDTDADTDTTTKTNTPQETHTDKDASTDKKRNTETDTKKLKINTGPDTDTETNKDLGVDESSDNR